MRIETTCETCGKTGDWEVGFFDNLKEAKDRPEDWGCIVMTKNNKPVNVPAEYVDYPWSWSEFCEQHNTGVAVFCPNCFRVGRSGVYGERRPTREEIEGDVE